MVFIHTKINFQHISPSAKAVILLGQHIGAPAKPIVAKGDVVKVGTKIAEPGGFVSAAIHSSVSGKVAKIDTIVDASGYAKPAIFIDVEGDEWEESIDRTHLLHSRPNVSSLMLWNVSLT